MANPPKSSDPNRKSQPSDAPKTRDERLEAALRANLKRRKKGRQARDDPQFDTQGEASRDDATKTNKR